MNDTPTKNLSAYRLERFALDEISATERESTFNKLREKGQNPDDIKAEIDASNADILAKYPPRMMAARIQDRLQKSTRPRAAKSRYFAAALTTTALATALLAVFVLPTDISTDSPVQNQQIEPGIRYKGLKPSLQIWRQTESNPEQLENNALATAGDRLQLRFQAAGAQHGLIASIDGRGQTTLHFPDFEGGDTTLPQGASTLNHSYQLDDAPEFERFFFITSAAPIDSAAVLDALEEFAEHPDAATDSLILPEDLSSTDFLVNKK